MFSWVLNIGSYYLPSVSLKLAFRNCFCLKEDKPGKPASLPTCVPLEDRAKSKAVATLDSRRSKSAQTDPLIPSLHPLMRAVIT